MVQRVTTLSSSAISSSRVSLRLGKASKKEGGDKTAWGFLSALDVLIGFVPDEIRGIELVDEVWVVLVDDLKNSVLGPGTVAVDSPRVHPFFKLVGLLAT